MVLLAGAIYGAAHISYPGNFVLTELQDGQILQPWKPYLCALFGLVSGMFIGMATEYMTSQAINRLGMSRQAAKPGP